MSKPTLAIVGASYGGLQLAASAREQGFDGRILLLGDEVHAPYQRPPLSKGLLTGKTRVEQLPLRSPAFYQEQQIELALGQRVTAIDVGQQRLSLADGAPLHWDWLALATGARCRPLTVPGAQLAGVLSLRSLDDALTLDAAAGRATGACVIGGGYIGLEVAAALAQRGLPVTMVEAQPRLLARSVPPVISRIVGERHRSQGVQIVCQRSVRALHGRHGRVAEVETDDGRRIAADLVVVGIGVLPNDELAAEAGLATGNGVLVDACGRVRGAAALPVLAVGDCAAQPNPFARDPALPLRLESIQAAGDGARSAAALLVGREQPNQAVPWFWSEQYDSKLQMAGLADADDRLVMRGRPEDGRFSAFFLREGRLVAAHSLNRPAEHMLARKLIAAGVRLTPAQLTNETFDLKSALPAEATA